MVRVVRTWRRPIGNNYPLDNKYPTINALYIYYMYIYILYIYVYLLYVYIVVSVYMVRVVRAWRRPIGNCPLDTGLLDTGHAAVLHQLTQLAQMWLTLHSPSLADR